MDLTFVAKTCLMLALICVFGTASRLKASDEPSIPVDAQDAEDTQHETDPVREFGRLVFAIRETIERKHLESPSHEAVTWAIVNALSELGDPRLVETTAAEFAACKTQKEFFEFRGLNQLDKSGSRTFQAVP